MSTGSDLSKVLDETDLPLDRAKDIAEALLKETDRGIAIVGAEHLSLELERLLRLAFIQEARAVHRHVDPLFTGFGPLSTFAARIQFAYAMGLIPEDIRRTLELVRAIRNKFAHSMRPLQLKDERVSQLIRQLVADGRKCSTEAGDDQTIRVGASFLQKGEFIEKLVFGMTIVALGGKLKAHGIAAQARGVMWKGRVA